MFFKYENNKIHLEVEFCFTEKLYSVYIKQQKTDKFMICMIISCIWLKLSIKNVYLFSIQNLQTQIVCATLLYIIICFQAILSFKQ